MISSTWLRRVSPPLVLFVLLGLPGAAQESAQQKDDADETAPPRQAPLVERQFPPAGPRARSQGQLKAMENFGRTLNIPAPEDVAAPPREAQRTDSGLAFKVLQTGSDDETPGRNDRAELHYTVWSTDGVALDSTENLDVPRSFDIQTLFPGFSEALQLMTTGERRRYWIPEELTYADELGRPAGMLVFDIELISFARAPQPPPSLAGPPDDAIRTESGLAYKVVHSAGGERPGEDDAVSVELNVWTSEGVLLDSSSMAGRPVEIRLELTFPAFRLLLPRMGRGDHWLIWSPPDLANLSDESIVASSILFDVQLLDFITRPQTPADVSVPPRDAETTFAGVRYKVLHSGDGGRHPQVGQRVQVDFAGWTRDGKMFDSSFDQGGPVELDLSAKKPWGFNEVLTMMVVGDRWRFWIPEDLAYAGQKGRPQGALCFEVELLAIKD
jgi:peptidylprolyl isomerase